MIFNKDDRVMVNLRSGSTRQGTVISSDNDRRITVMLETGTIAILDPWDVFPDEDDPVYRRKLALAIDADIERDMERYSE